MDNDTLISLQDLDTGLSYTTRLSSEDARRVETDITFATEVLAALKKSQDEPGPSNPMVSTESNLNDEIATEQDSTLIFKWSHQAVLLLIEEYRKREEDAASGKLTQRRLWESISKVLCNHGHDVTGLQCQSKFNGMKRTFKSIKDHNSKSGNNPRSWPYTETMESLLGEKPFMNPVALASSSRSFTETDNSDVSSLDSCDSSVSHGFSSSSSRKRKSHHIADAILESRKIAEDSKTKRHEQNMNQREKLLNALDKLIDKLQ